MDGLLDPEFLASLGPCVDVDVVLRRLADRPVSDEEHSADTQLTDHSADSTSAVTEIGCEGMDEALTEVEEVEEENFAEALDAAASRITGRSQDEAHMAQIATNLISAEYQQAVDQQKQQQAANADQTSVPPTSEEISEACSVAYQIQIACSTGDYDSALARASQYVESTTAKFSPNHVMVAVAQSEVATALLSRAQGSAFTFADPSDTDVYEAAVLFCTCYKTISQASPHYNQLPSAASLFCPGFTCVEGMGNATGKPGRHCSGWTKLVADPRVPTEDPEVLNSAARQMLLVCNASHTGQFGPALGLYARIIEQHNQARDQLAVLGPELHVKVRSNRAQCFIGLARRWALKYALRIVTGY